MSFQLTALAGSMILVEGTDVRGITGSEVLDSTEWDEVKRRDTFKGALADVDAAIAALVAPITAAVEAANEKIKMPELDPLFYVVDQEETTYVAGQRKMLSKLGRDSVILRAIEEGKSDRLIWVKDELVVTAVSAVPAAPVVDSITVPGDPPLA